MANHFKAFVTWKEGNLKPSSLMSGVKLNKHIPPNTCRIKYFVSTTTKKDETAEENIAQDSPDCRYNDQLETINRPVICTSMRRILMAACLEIQDYYKQDSKRS
jgi:hypothetical protein